MTSTDCSRVYEIRRDRCEIQPDSTRSSVSSAMNRVNRHEMNPAIRPSAATPPMTATKTHHGRPAVPSVRP